jgi:tRNA (guanine10-N2)-dimethyltransferase
MRCPPVAKLFFLLSGEHSTLPVSELKAILEAEGHDYRLLGTFRQVAQVEAKVESIKSIVRRAALTRVCCIELVSTQAVAGEIFEEVRSASFETCIEKGETFVVRVRRVGETTPEIKSADLEQKIGAIILDKIEGAKVKLINPNRTFFGVITEGKFFFGLKLAEVNPKPFVERRPRKRPFFHPSAMQAKLARCMVNLAQPETGNIVLDPFCGTGSLLIEAGLIGCKVMGLDVQKRMTKGSLLNLCYYGVKPEGVVRASALCLPFKEIDCIVTDPPYGRSATTLGRKIEEIVEDFLSTAIEYIPRGKRICIASPKSIEIGKISEKLGLKLVESFSVYVHRSLTREIAVLERI